MLTAVEALDDSEISCIELTAKKFFSADIVNNQCNICGPKVCTYSIQTCAYCKAIPKRDEVWLPANSL